MYGNGNPEKPGYNSLSDFCYKGNTVEIRIPWQLLNVMDPSTKMVMDDLYRGGIRPVETAGIYAGLIIKKGEKVMDRTEMKMFSWSRWEFPSYHERLKESYYIVKKAFENY